MRLLVHGGNSFNERRRIGIWSKSITPQMLESMTNLSEKYPAFGVGVLEEDVKAGYLPFVIFRKLKLSKGRFYPISLFLDPGEEIWKNFEWNPAFLLFKLFGNANSPYEELLNNPEKFHSEKDLERLLSEFKEKFDYDFQDCDFTFERGRLARIWTQTHLTESPIIVKSGEKPIFKVRPGLCEMASFLQDIPPNLRLNKGWLIGGTFQQSSDLGVNLVYDDGAEKKISPDEEQVIDKLSDTSAYTSFKKVFDELKENRIGLEYLPQFFENPLIIWQKENKISLESVFNDIELFEKLFDISQQLPNDQNEKSLIKDAQHRLANVDNVFNHDIKKLFENRINNIPPETRLKIFEEQAINLFDNQNTETSLLDIYNKWFKTNSIDEINAELIKSTVKNIFNRVESSPDLILRLYKEINKIGQERYLKLIEYFDKEFYEFSRTQKVLSSPNYRHFYFLFGNDENGEATDEHINEIVKFVISNRNGSESWKDKADIWLKNTLKNRLYSLNSEVRVNHLQKLEGEEKFASPELSGYFLLLRLLKGKDFSQLDKNYSDEEQLNLFSVIKTDFLSLNSELLIPRLRKLKTYFNFEFDSKIEAIFKDIKVSLSDETLEKKSASIDWLSGWKKESENYSNDKLQTECSNLITNFDVYDIFGIFDGAQIEIEKVFSREEGVKKLSEICAVLILKGKNSEDEIRSQRFYKVVKNLSDDLKGKVLRFIYKECKFGLQDSAPNRPSPTGSNVQRKKDDLKIFGKNLMNRIEAKPDSNGKSLLDLFKENLIPEDQQVLDGKIRNHKSSLADTCLIEIKRRTNLQEESVIKKRLSEIKDQYKEPHKLDIFKLALQKFFEQFEKDMSPPDWEKTLAKVAQDLVDFPTGKYTLKSEIEEYLFSDTIAHEHAEKQLKSLLEKNDREEVEEVENHIRTILGQFLEQERSDEQDKEGKIFFGRYLKSREKQANKIYSNVSLTLPKAIELDKESIASKLFCLFSKEEVQYKFLLTLLKNEKITDEFFNFVWNEYKASSLLVDMNKDKRGNKEMKNEITSFRKTVLNLLVDNDEYDDALRERFKELERFISRESRSKPLIPINELLPALGVDISKKKNSENALINIFQKLNRIADLAQDICINK